MSNIKIMLRSGEYISLVEWQEIYSLEVGSDQIGKYFRARERKFKEDLERYGELIVNDPLIRVLDYFRATIKQPVIINSFNRNEAKQEELKAQGARAAGTSPHVVKMAADIDTTSPEQTRAWAIMLRRCAIDINVRIRIGTEKYLKDGNTFIHIDVCPEYYAVGKPFHHHPHPQVWERVINW
jgi:hypothetical protein